MEATLTSILGIVPLRDSVLTIGRAPNNGLFINHAGISRHHAELRLEGQGYSIVDLGSTSGTFVNGERLISQTPRLLQSGDAIQVGNFPCLYEEKSLVQSQVATPPLERSSAPDWPLSKNVARAQSGIEHPPVESDLLAVPELVSLSPVSDGLLPTPVEPVSPLPDVSPIPPRAAKPVGISPALPREQLPLGGPPMWVNAPITPVPASYVVPQKPTLDLARRQLQFTTFYRREAAVESWQTLLVYTHVEDTLDAVREDARRLQALLDAGAPPADIQAAHPLRGGTQITVVPVVPGITFQPERVSFTWTDEWQPAALRFFADRSHADSVCMGEILLLAGPLIIASLRVSLRFAAVGMRPEIEQEELSVARYKNIFASYSQEDKRVVQAIRRAYEALGDESFLDIEALRAGQSWNTLLPRAIESADVFQVFWSQHAAKAPIVYQECQYALQHDKYEGFIRPIYWEQPLAFSPPELARLHFTYYEFPPQAE